MGAGWGGLQGGVAGPEGRPALGMCSQGLHIGPQHIQNAPVGGGPAGIDTHSQGQNGSRAHVGTAMLALKAL